MAVEPKIAIARILANLNLAVRYGIAIRISLILINMRVGNFGGFFNLAVVDCQIAKFNSPPNFPAIRYTLAIYSYMTSICNNHHAFK